LSDLLIIWDENEKALHTNIIIDRLINNNNGDPWRYIKKDRPIDDRFLAQLLSQFNIYPNQVRAGPEAKSLKGYRRSDFVDAWSRYLPEQGKQEKQEKQPDPSSSSPSGSETEETPETIDPIADWSEWIRSREVAAGRKLSDNRSLDEGSGYQGHKLKFMF